MTDPVAQLAGIAYQPQTPKHYAPQIGMIGCGGITVQHLRAYKAAGLTVSALCDIERPRAAARAAEFFPEAKIYDDYRELLRDATIEVVDITTHPADRVPIIKAALLADKHVLSQKPFVLDLDEGLRLIELAESRDRYLAVNQNGRWAPHFSYARQAVAGGFLGDVFGAHLGCHWDHRWVMGTEFEKVKHLILYDYAIHWFDIVRCFFAGKAAKRVFASTARAPGQRLAPHLLGQALIEFDEAQCTLAFDASLPFGQLDQTFLSGTLGSLHSSGLDIQRQTLRVSLESGSWSPVLEGQWFPDGFHGTMGELLCAIEDRRECSINARGNLDSLALCFAAIASAETGQPIVPGTIRKLPT
jgi:predicted dehydrogenase